MERIAFTYRPKPRPQELCQLAGVWRGEMPDGGAMIEVKHDGFRFLWINGQAFTRNGMPYRGIGHIERALALLERQFDCPMFLDGEFVVGEGVHTLAATKAHQERGWRQGDAGRLHLFDCLPMADWKADDSETPLYERKKALSGAIAGMLADPLAWEMGWSEGVECPIRIVPDQWAFERRDVERMALDVWAAGGEGVMAKDAMAPYRRKRTDAWRKYRRDLARRRAA